MIAKVGDLIEIIKMDGEPQSVGRTGRVTSIDDIGQIHGTWGGCALVSMIDRFIILADFYSTPQQLIKNK